MTFVNLTGHISIDKLTLLAFMNDGFEKIIVRRIPSRVIKFCIKDKAWFNGDWKQANLAK